MSKTDDNKNWTKLSSRRQEIVVTAVEDVDEEEFRRTELNVYLDRDTTTTTLNNLTSDGYLHRTQAGGGLVLMYLNPDKPEGGNAEFSDSNPAARESRAKKVVRKHGLRPDPTDVNWTDNEEMRAFCEDVNAEAVRRGITGDGEDLLRLTGTANKYRVTDLAVIEVEKRQGDDEG